MVMKKKKKRENKKTYKAVAVNTPLVIGKFEKTPDNPLVLLVFFHSTTSHLN